MCWLVMVGVRRLRGDADAPFAIAAREYLRLAEFTTRSGAFPADTLVTINA